MYRDRKGKPITNSGIYGYSVMGEWERALGKVKVEKIEIRDFRRLRDLEIERLESERENSSFYTLILCYSS